MAKRKAISKRTRFEVFKRDEFTCQYCGSQPPDVVLEVDHIVPVSDGGTNEESNLITACFDCNRGKSNVSLNVAPDSIGKREERAREIREQLEAYNDYLMEIRKHQDKQIEELGLYWHDQYMHEKGKYVFGHARKPTIRRFLKRLPVAEILDAMDIAYAKFPETNDDLEDPQMWRYFCGVCWTKISNREGQP